MLLLCILLRFKEETELKKTALRVYLKVNKPSVFTSTLWLQQSKIYDQK